MFSVLTMILLVYPSQILALYFGSGAATNHHIHRRGIALLCYQMEQTLGHSCMDYMGYGCFCGPGGYGTAVDESDRCCEQHDRCYGEVKCKHSWYDYFVHYQVECTQSGCQCTDTEEISPCAYTSCECDRVFVECLRLNQPINPRYKKYDKIQCNASEMSHTDSDDSSEISFVSSQTSVTSTQTKVTFSRTNATPSKTNVAFSERNVAFSKTIVPSLETKVTSTQTNVTSTQKNVTSTQTNVTSTQKNVTSSETPVMSSQTPVRSLKNTLMSTPPDVNF
ncbi:hypothetical protein Btru_037277 [Bulinus truncatus]|nr:hypothetical protein Btru_037277 [Bulinus truncatus]